jgi:lysine 2,3-aminomutase
MSIAPRALEQGAQDLLDQVARRYAVAVSPTLVSLIDPADPADPIARQFLPSLQELTTLTQESADPIGDEAHAPVPGIVHRHPGRVLFKAVSACPVYCRFCFRRETVGPGKENALNPASFEAALAYVQDHPEIGEVILTGGDPFILSPRRIEEIASRLAAIGHVRIVRWHTRVPLTDPGRVSDELVAALQGAGATTWVAIHANHANEFGLDARRAIARLADAGIPLVSQSVLLRGVNDTVEAMAALMRIFVQNRIKPYYLHHPDLAPGTSHFRPTIAEGLALMKTLRRELSGLEMPAYTLDIPGGFGKIPLESDHLDMSEAGIRVRDANGTWHSYQDHIAG